MSFSVNKLTLKGLKLLLSATSSDLLQVLSCKVSTSQIEVGQEVPEISQQGFWEKSFDVYYVNVDESSNVVKIGCLLGGLENGLGDISAKSFGIEAKLASQSAQESIILAALSSSEVHLIRDTPHYSTLEISFNAGSASDKISTFYKSYHINEFVGEDEDESFFVSTSSYFITKPGHSEEISPEYPISEGEVYSQLRPMAFDIIGNKEVTKFRQNENLNVDKYIYRDSPNCTDDYRYKILKVSKLHFVEDENGKAVPNLGEFLKEKKTGGVFSVTLPKNLFVKKVEYDNQ